MKIFEVFTPTMSLLDLPANTVITAVAAGLEKNDKFSIPEWYGTTRAGANNERVPDSPTLWYQRVASILRTVALKGPVGVQRLRNKYGGRRQHTRGPEHRVKGSGKVVRTALQQLEAAGFVAKSEKGGRVIAPAGQSALDKATKA